MKRKNTHMLPGILGFLTLLLSPVAGECQNQDSEWRRLNEQGNKLCESGQYAEAEKVLLSALAEAQKSGLADSRLATSQNNLAACYHAEARYAEAAELYERALGSGKTPPSQTSKRSRSS